MFLRLLLATLVALGIAGLGVLAMLRRLEREWRLLLRLRASEARLLPWNALDAREQAAARDLAASGLISIERGVCRLAPRALARLARQRMRLALSSLLAMVGLIVLVVVLLRR